MTEPIRCRPMTGYGAELSVAWADHLAPRKPDAPTVVSLFAGCGGSSLGYSMAGFRELLAVEWDDHAAAMFRLNFPDVPLCHGDVTDLDPAVLGLAPGELDVLDGSPPCQGFSTSGRRRTDDPRNDLFREYARLLDAWQPRMFVMENVSGLVKGKMRLKFAEMLAALKAAGPGYRVTVQLMDASWFRVPQQRQRLVFLGVRNDLGTEPRFPPPERHRISVRAAWSDLTDRSEMPSIGAHYKVASLVPHVLPGSNGAVALKRANRKGSFFNLSRLHWDRPASTIPKSTVSSLVSKLHPSLDRPASAPELARLQSFPDEYDFADSTYVEIHARLGNSVPPLFMRAIATTIRDGLDAIDREAVQL
jgi:DNA (cytosine-5)-methyltransferase 1